MSVLSGLLRPEVERHLLTTEREFVVDEVRKHWVTRVPGMLLVALGCFLLLGMAAMGRGWWLGLLAGLAAGAAGFWKVHVQNMDRFVITNVRVFRVNGVLNQKLASVPLARLLDVSMQRPFLGQIIGFGHFVFETAAQDQGLKVVSFVPKIERHQFVLQGLIQRAGVRAKAADRPDEVQDLMDVLTADPGPRARRPLGRRRPGRSAQLDVNDLDGV